MKARLTRNQVRSVDAIATNELKIPSILLMENAGRNTADRVQTVAEESDARRVVIFCGPGNNGGDGFSIARHLLNREIRTDVYLTANPEKLSTDAATNHRILVAMGHKVQTANDAAAMKSAAATIEPTDVVVDALLGTGFQGEVRAPLATLITAVNDAKKTATVAVDVPSGLDCDTGQPSNATIRATHTVTFVAAKTGFAEPGADRFTGKVFVVDIGAPPSLVHRVLSESAK